jgi:lipoyl(octanoyl) transferase
LFVVHRAFNDQRPTNNHQPAFLSLQSKSIDLDKQTVTYKDLGLVEYKTAWDYQEKLLKENVDIKSSNRLLISTENGDDRRPTTDDRKSTTHYLILCEHPPVYTLGKSGHMENLLLPDEEIADRGIQFFKTNRGGDITFHGPQQIVGYPILDLERFYTDIGRYLRELEEAIIHTLLEYGIKGERSNGETGVWIDVGIPGKERKICAMGVRCSRWITMHGFALNVNTELDYFNNIIPCGIQNKQVTSMEKELGRKLDFEEVKEKLKKSFSKVFNIELEN